MKTIATILFSICCLITYAQNEIFQLQGKIISKDGTPVSDVYIVNPRNMEKDVSHSDGIFTVEVLPGDSLVLSHISFSRMIVKVQTLLLNPIIVLKSDNVNIKEIRVTPDKTTDMDRAKQNLSFLNEYKPLEYTKIKQEVDPVQSTMVENNRLMRVEAASISLGRFSPSKQIGKIAKKLKRKDRSNDYYSTKKQKKPENEED